MLTVNGVSKSFGGRTLFQDVSLQVNQRDRIALVGPNGAGKSTFFSMVLGDASPDKGEILTQKGFTIGYLPQESAPPSTETVIELATAISPEFVRLRDQIKAYEHDHPEITEFDDDLHSRYDELGGYQIEPKAKRILAGLSFRESDFNRPTREMSGGWVMRAYLARLLVMEPDLLMLDEPTNHLDLESLLWLQGYLKTYEGAILLISHDREFINELVTSIVEIRQSKLIQYRGNYDSFLMQREANEAQLLAAYKNQQKEIEKLMDFVNRFRAKNTKAAQAQSKLKQIERMEKIEAPVIENRKISFSFPQPERSGQRVIRMTNIHQAYGKNIVYQGMNFEAERFQRMVLVGPNGAGKSTLLKLLAGNIEFQEGERELGHNVKAGYYAQYRLDMLDEKRTVLDEALDTPQRITEESVRTLLGCFLFTGDDVFKLVGVLSGGEKSRLAMVKILLNPPNLLLLDEPTTHLDIPSIDALVEALKNYQGTLIFISHDVYFIRAIANHVVHVNAGQLTHYKGDYQYYLDKTSSTSAREALTAGGANAPVVQKMVKRTKAEIKEQKRREAEARQARSKGRKDQQQKVYQLEKKITELEAKQKSLTEDLEKPETYENPGKAVQINRELAAVTTALETAQSDWEEAAMKLEEIE